MSLATTKATTMVELKSQAKVFEGRILFINCRVRRVRRLSFFSNIIVTLSYFFNKYFAEGEFYGAIGGLTVLICLLLSIIVILIYFVRLVFQ